MNYTATLIACLVTTVALAQTKPITTPPASKAAIAAVKSPGQTIYEQHCLTCHQANGSGVPNLNPPLRNVDWVTGDKTRLIHVLLKGLQGQEIDGETYDNVMPAHDFLTDQQLADVLTYIRTSFGNKASEIKPEEVKALREKK